MGDFITAPSAGNNQWIDIFCRDYRSGNNIKLNHAVGGTTIGDMDAQTVAAAADDADLILIALGTNDNDAGDMAALQAEVEENIAELTLQMRGRGLYT